MIGQRQYSHQYIQPCWGCVCVAFPSLSSHVHNCDVKCLLKAVMLRASWGRPSWQDCAPIWNWYCSGLTGNWTVLVSAGLVAWVLPARLGEQIEHFHRLILTISKICLINSLVDSQICGFLLLRWPTSKVSILLWN